MRFGFGCKLAWVLLLLALMLSSHTVPPIIRAQGSAARRINVPYFEGEIPWAEAGIFWFGRVTPAENYADVRVGYNDDELYLRLAAFDRRLWYDTTPSFNDLTAWDAATVYLDLDGNVGNEPDENAYRFVGQLSWWEPRGNYQAAYQGDGSGWVIAAVPITVTTGWRGNAPNDDINDAGWAVAFHIPFASLGLSGPPTHGTTWGLSVVLHDRDDDGVLVPDKTWPESVDPERPATWGQLAFGLLSYTPSPASPAGTVTIRHRLNGAEVVDVAVGAGQGLCGGGDDVWTEWGETNHAGQGDFNIQNQTDVADWPCFSKYYVTFPLDALPPGKVIISATLTLHQFGNAGGGSWGEPEPSLIQVFTVAEDWGETTLTWNNAPLARENIASAWVDPLPSFPGWPGVPRTWDVSRAVAQAYAAGDPLRIALYSADSAYHSGKYFVSSDTGDWNAVGRPTLTVGWGDPVGTVDKRVYPLAPSADETITYTMAIIGSGRALTMTDTLPEALSDPGPIQATAGSATYNAAQRLVEWHGTPAIRQPVTVTFCAVVQSSGRVALVNTAILTDAIGSVSTDTAIVIVNGLMVYLPLLFKLR